MPLPASQARSIFWLVPPPVRLCSRPRAAPVLLSPMPWVAVNADDGIPWPGAAPMAALNRARRHRVYTDCAWLLPGGYQWHAFRAYCPDSHMLQHVNVLYVCTHAPEQQGDCFTVQKYYFSDNYHVQWMHVRAASTARAWRFSDFIFHVYYA